MEKFKIVVLNNQSEQEVISLCGELGFKSDYFSEYDYPKFISNHCGYISDYLINGSPIVSKYKEITLPELKDMVVLKRNSVDDATHENSMYCYVELSDGWYYLDDESNKWTKSTGGKPSYFDNLKPIEKEMKEWINKVTGEYKKAKCMFGHSNWVEVPDGSEVYAKASDNEYSFWRGNCQWLEWDNDWSISEEDAFAEWKEEWSPIIIWQRPQQPESLPFVDDETDYLNQGENGERLMNSIEQLKQSAWSKQEGGSHYKNLAIQPMEYALKNKLDYAQANVVKYVTRHADKNGKEDLLKAIHNIELMIEHYYP